MLMQVIINLQLEQGEPSLVFYLKPKDTHIKNPSNSKSNQRMNFLMRYKNKQSRWSRIWKIC